MPEQPVQRAPGKSLVEGRSSQTRHVTISHEGIPSAPIHTRCVRWNSPVEVRKVGRDPSPTSKVRIVRHPTQDVRAAPTRPSRPGKPASGASPPGPSAPRWRREGPTSIEGHPGLSRRIVHARQPGRSRAPTGSLKRANRIVHARQPGRSSAPTGSLTRAIVYARVRRARVSGAEARAPADSGVVGACRTTTQTEHAIRPLLSSG